jgi:hypothetical protein
VRTGGIDEDRPWAHVRLYGVNESLSKNLRNILYMLLQQQMPSYMSEGLGVFSEGGERLTLGAV